MGLPPRSTVRIPHSTSISKFFPQTQALCWCEKPYLFSTTTRNTATAREPIFDNFRIVTVSRHLAIPRLLESPFSTVSELSPSHECLTIRRTETSVLATAFQGSRKYIVVRILFQSKSAFMGEKKRREAPVDDFPLGTCSDSLGITDSAHS